MLAVVVTAAVLAVQRDQPDTSVVPEAILAAEQPSSAGQAQPPFRASVNLVRVDVYATTSSGPVLDLGQNDFEVYENGVLQKIGSFEHVVSRVPVPEFERIGASLGRRGTGRRRRPPQPPVRRALRHAEHRGLPEGRQMGRAYLRPAIGRPRTDDVPSPQHRRGRPGRGHAPRDVALVAAFHAAAVALRRIPAVGGGVAEAFHRRPCRRGRKTVRRLLRGPHGAGHLRRYGRPAPRDEAARHAAGTRRLAWRTARGAQGGVRGQRGVGTLPAGRAPRQATPGPSAVAARHREDPRQDGSRPATRAATSPTRRASATA